MLKDISNGKSHDDFLVREAMANDVTTSSTKIALKYLELYTRGECVGHFDVFTVSAWKYCFDAAIEICEATASDSRYCLATRCEAKYTVLVQKSHPDTYTEADISVTNELISSVAKDYMSMLKQIWLITVCTDDENLWTKVGKSSIEAMERIHDTLRLMTEYSVADDEARDRLIEELESELRLRIGGPYVPDPNNVIPGWPTLAPPE
ncbi:MAG: hypothetical protein ABIY70_28000 [Capsulimonas sp.]|uniref:hypothetical protein n=1 Tax=Capsulimonas sp. TaxID=2494211 RepID=UPI00326303DF